jgi:hypothetical protein
MATPALVRDFKEFLKLLNSNNVEYLLIGGYAVGIYGYVRATNDLDIWISANAANAAKVERALRDFGFAAALTSDLFVTPNNIIRMGVPPVRIEILTSISGVEFEPCYAEKRMVEIEELTVPVISLARLRENKKASGGRKIWRTWKVCRTRSPVNRALTIVLRQRGDSRTIVWLLDGRM